MNTNPQSPTSNPSAKLRAGIQYPAIALILAAFIALGITYSLVTPIFESPDEIYHYFVIKHLADGKGLPVQNPEDPGLWEQEGSQPPLYYLMGALATFWIDTSDAEDLLWRNPQANIGTPLDPGNKNVIVHTQRESFPFRGAALAVHLVRLLSVLLGAGTVFLTYRLALEIFPDHEHLAVGAAAINAFIPQFLFISGSVNNDNLVIFLASLALLLITRHTHHWTLDIRYWVLLGFVLGLACLSKLSGLGLLILTAIILIAQAYRRRSARALVGGMIALAVAVAVAGWWYVRNWTLYGDPTGLNMMLDVVGRGSPPSSLSKLWGELRGLRMSFWGLFGWFSILVAPAAYAILDTVSLFALAGLGGWFVRRRWRGPYPLPRRTETRFLGAFVPKTRAVAGTSDTPGSIVERKKPGFLTQRRDNQFALEPLMVLILWLVIVSMSLARWIWTTAGAQGRLLFPAISAISILLMLGLSQLVPGRYAKAIVIVISLAMFVFAALCPFLYISPAYARPPILSSDEIPPGVTRLNVDFEDGIRLLGYQLDREKVRPGETLGITLYWQGLVEMKAEVPARDYYLFIHLLGRRGELVGHEDTYHGWGSYPTSLWTPAESLTEEIIADAYRLPISENVLAPSLIRVDTGLYDPTTGLKLKPQSVVIGQVKMLPQKHREYAIDNQLDFTLGNKVALLGYKVDKTELGPGEQIRLTLYWRAEGEMGTDYTVFTHLIDEAASSHDVAAASSRDVAAASSRDVAAHIWGQMDSQPLEGDYPTSFWDIGEIIEDEYILAINEDTPAGSYRLEVGMYELATRQRLPILSDDGETMEDNRILLPLTILITSVPR